MRISCPTCFLGDGNNTSHVLFVGDFSFPKIDQLTGRTGRPFAIFFHHANPDADAQDRCRTNSINFTKISPSAERPSNLHFTAGI
jgi:hypothetical protein